MRTTTTIALLLLATGTASADTLTFRDRPLTDPQAKAVWADRLAREKPTGMIGGAPSSSLTAVLRDGSDTWTISQLHDRGWCGMSTCLTRVTRNGALVMDADLCIRSKSDDGMPWRLDPATRTLTACGDSIQLATSSPVPERVAEPKVTKASVAPATADVLGEPFDHNGSVMTIAHSDGLIVYAEPKRSIAGTVRPGTVLFRGGLENPDRVTGTAYTFKKGCTPAPYQVSGRFAGGQLSGTLTLSGKAPVRAKNGCDVTGYSATSGNAKLVFNYIAPPEM